MENKIEYPVETIYNTTDNSFCMKYIQNNTLFEVISKENNKEEIFNILSYLKNLHKVNEIPVDINRLKEDLLLETTLKIQTRYDKVHPILSNFSNIKYVNNVKIDTYENIIIKVNGIIERFINKNNLKYNIIHGDLNLSNIRRIS